MNFVCTRCKRDVETPGLFCPFCGAPAPQPDAEPSDPYIGKTIAEKYFVNALLGRGGMGQVYKATHLTLDRPVALKMLARSFQSDPSMVQRFHREARAASKLNHPHCINILDFGQAEDGTLFIAMEYLAGRSLERILADEFPLGELRVVRIVGQILGALAEAHAAGVIHRDLKLSNVMVEARRDDPDFVKVLDFGIAKLSDAGPAGQLTGTGIVCGTPGYMSPEQARGEELDARSDLYAVGVILYELLSGRLPFVSDTPMGFVTKHMTETPRSLREARPDLSISPGLDAIVMRVLSKDRESRPASAEELREILYTCELAPVSAPSAPVEGRGTMVLTAAADPSGAARPGPAARGTGPTIRKFEDPRRSGVAPGPNVAPAGGSPSASVATPGTPAPGAGAPRAASGPRTPAPPPPGRAAPPSIQPPSPRTPAPARDAAGADEPDAVQPAPSPRPVRAAPAPRRPIRPALVAGGAVVVLGAILAYVAFRNDPFAAPQAGPSAAPAQGPRLKKEPETRAAVQPPAAPATPAAAPDALAPPAPAPAVIAAPGGAGPGPAAPVPTAPSADPRPVEEPEAPRADRRPRRPVEKGAGAVQVVEGMNVLPVPSAASGQGILTVAANPWATVFLDGKELGETPREARVHAGAYKVRLSHPTLGVREAWISVSAGKRRIHNVNLSK